MTYGSFELLDMNDFNILVAEEYLKFFDFTGDTLDVALRKFLKQFSLTGETQERERVLAHFSRHYLQSNPGTYNSEDACHTLVCAIMLLNTDLHGQAVGRKMQLNEFIENLAELNDGENFPREVLKALYQAIKAEPIEWAPDEEFQEVGTTLGEDQKVQQQQQAPNLPSLPAAVVGRNPFLDVPDPSQTTEYKKGYMMRKCCLDPDGRKTPVGKRGWRMLYVVLRDMILYLYKDEQALKKSGQSGPHQAVRVHHCLATKASDYTKKQHVFRLHTADWAEYLFQTSNTKECQEWIDILNFVAASLSAPPLPGAVGSQKRFQRPLLPASYTRLNLQDQLKSLEEMLAHTEQDLQEHRQTAPEKGSKPSTIQHFLEKEGYLSHEVTRLKTYIYLLQSRLTLHPELEPSLVETTIGEDEEGFKGINPVNHISPTHRKAGPPHSLSDREGENNGPTTVSSSKLEKTGNQLLNQTENQSVDQTDLTADKSLVEPVINVLSDGLTPVDSEPSAEKSRNKERYSQRADEQKAEETDLNAWHRLEITEATRMETSENKYKDLNTDNTASVIKTVLNISNGAMENGKAIFFNEFGELINVETRVTSL